ncbi:phytase [Fulvivirgaceae bacterium PWU4]|uniref:Phytase n=1 Tax=Chryseosolibacter histidini TaxID=2782349 RepID=A0AAP2DR34_9BACT|nr:phytase [Chryseosolibacter histidini]MBT1698774.1 phytase [Chryseosolibacter histidini]
MYNYLAVIILVLLLCSACTPSHQEAGVSDTLRRQTVYPTQQVVEPAIVTEPVMFDTDDPAIWVNPADPSQSLIIGTDKDENGGLYAFDLQGKIIKEKTQSLKRPDNVDIEYGVNIGGRSYDIAVTTERLTHKLRIYSVPYMKPLDNGGIEVFTGETGDMFRDLMGIALYKNASGDIYAIVGRKNGPDGTYLWQYKLEDNGHGAVKATLVRKFGKYSGKKEIEAIAVDDKPGYVYYSDEGVGVRKYYADPAKGNEELALFGTSGFTQDHEGISIYQVSDSTGYILVSDQGANQFFVFSREGFEGNPHDHRLVKIIKVAAQESDGSDVTSVSLNDTFRNGLFVVMSTDKTFHYYRWEDIAGDDLNTAANKNQTTTAYGK